MMFAKIPQASFWCFDFEEAVVGPCKGAMTIGLGGKYEIVLQGIKFNNGMRLLV